MKPYKISILNTGIDDTVVSVLYAQEFTSDDAPTIDEIEVAQELTEQLGGEWEISSAGWDSGDHPTQLEAIARFVRVQVNHGR